MFQKNSVLHGYQDCFSDKPGKFPNKRHLEVDTSVPPVVHPPTKIPVAMLEPAREKLKKMEEAGIIVKEDEPTSWVSLMLVIAKRKVNDKRKDTPPSKDDLRICIDPRYLTKALKRPHYPTVTVEEVANRLAGAKSFTSLDACSGYWQLLVDDESSKLSGAPNGNFRENICSEDDLRTRTFGTFVVKFLACLPLLGFSYIYKMV